MFDFELRDMVVVDTETTGVDPFVHDILLVGLVSMAKDYSEELYVQLPSNPIWSTFAENNFLKFSSQWKKNAMPALDVVRSIERFVEACGNGREVIFVGHNFSFDRMFLQKLTKVAGVEKIRGVSHRSIDTFTLLRSLSICGLVPEEAQTSDGAFKYFDIKIQGDARHTALADALATKILFKKLLEILAGVSSSGKS
ncbi:3'-5' exonuclease [Xanthomonas vasicola]|uniref:3'-5' exonuclease n=1 Tax=Xanthomonas vasicola TaxID=56459 RepID=UPI000BE365D5|nr:3'-5' exonuclease [Xanthomonas vasicola]PDM34504.1 hypothetical protein CQW50_10015 [Xanthomonas vasicola pv. vasculorum]